MGLILSIETSGKVCSVALHDQGILLGLKETLIEKSHSKLLTILITALFSETNYKLKDLSAIAISRGPGSYTGLRIGSSTAKGLCYALEKPFISIDTLESMAYESNKFNFENFLICPMLDARRMEVYCALYDSSGSVINDTSAKIIDGTAFGELLETNKLLFVGDGAAKCMNIINSSNAYFQPECYPTAKNIGYLAYKKFLIGDFEDASRFDPLYLKEFTLNR